MVLPRNFLHAERLPQLVRQALSGRLAGMRRLPLAALFVLASIKGAAADQVMDRVEVKTSPEKAWAEIGDFCGIKNWHPAVVSCELTGEGAPRVRTLTLQGGAKMIEKEMSWNDRGRAYSYTTLEGPLPVTNTTAMIKVLPGDRGKVNLVWTSSFKPIGSSAEAKKALETFYLAGLQSLKAKLEER
jgi:hypothetical protein